MSSPASPDPRTQIRNTFAAYCHAIDDGRFDDFIDCFTKDGAVLVMDQRIEGRDAIRAWMQQAQPPERRGRHVNMNITIDLESPDRAHAVSDFVFLARNGTEWRVAQLGRYVDQLVDDDGTWRFAERRIILGTEPGD